jgi:hypothetical protein
VFAGIEGPRQDAFLEVLLQRRFLSLQVPLVYDTTPVGTPFPRPFPRPVSLRCSRRGLAARGAAALENVKKTSAPPTIRFPPLHRNVVGYCRLPRYYAG